jgi:DNA polymerase III epsilon subunit-like protein
MQPRIIEIGLIIVEDGIITSTYGQLIKPCNIKITPKITRITGLTSSPSFREVRMSRHYGK